MCYIVDAICSKNPPIYHLFYIYVLHLFTKNERKSWNYEEGWKIFRLQKKVNICQKQKFAQLDHVSTTIFFLS